MMKTRTLILILGVAVLSASHLGMGRNAQYDEDARAADRARKEAIPSEKNIKPVRGIASGVKEAAVDSTAGLISETAQGTANDSPIVGTLEGARLGTGKVLDSAVRGGYKVATLGMGELESYQVEEPEAGTGDTTKITIKIPGT